MTSLSSLDTNVILRLITKDNEKMYQRAAALFEDTSQELLIDDAAIIETVYVLDKVYRQTRKQIVEELTATLSLGRIKSSPLFLSSVLPLYLSHPKLSFVDIYLAEKAEKSHAKPLWTFDKKLSTQLPQPKYLA